MRAQVLLLITSAVFSQAAPIGDEGSHTKRSAEVVDYGCSSFGKRFADVVEYGCGSSFGKRSAVVDDGRSELNQRAALVRDGYGESRTSNGKRGESGLEEPVSARGYADSEDLIVARSAQGVIDASCGYKRSPQGALYTDCGYKRSTVDNQPEGFARQGSESEPLVARDD